ncbi:MAG: hypothetical protein JSR82_23240 [Verrucomicrobia bacterium]|nr:hypothetical protein [Verrucomicrobiota bacterium]
MKHDDLPARWKEKISAWLAPSGGGARSQLGASDFPREHSVRLRFEDDSCAEFRSAIVLEAPEWREVGVFTEHCGYHIFPLGGTQIVRFPC